MAGLSDQRSNNNYGQTTISTVEKVFVNNDMRKPPEYKGWKFVIITGFILTVAITAAITTGICHKVIKKPEVIIKTYYVSANGKIHNTSCGIYKKFMTVGEDCFYCGGRNK